MATPEENKPAERTTESANAKVDTHLINSGLSSQHSLFANLVKNRGGFIQPQKSTISKSSCDRCAAHRRSSLTDLQALSVNSISDHHRDDNHNPYHHHHHPSCPNYTSRSSSRSSISKQHAINESKLPTGARRPPQAKLLSSAEHRTTYIQQPVIHFPPPATTERGKPGSGIPVRTLKVISSSPSSLIDNQMTSGNKMSKIPRPISAHSHSSTRYSAATDDNTDEFLRSGLNNDSDQTLSVASNYKTGDREDNDIFTKERMTKITCGDTTQLNRDSKMATTGESDNIIIPSGAIDTLTVRFRPTDIHYEVHINQNMTVGDVIVDVCRQAHMDIHDDYYLWVNLRELNINDTIFQAGLYQTSNSIKDLPEVRLKYLQVLQTSSHLGKQVFLTSPEHIAYDQLLNIPLPSTKKHVVPHILKTIAEQIVQRTSCFTQLFQKDGTVLIPLPNFSKQSIDSLPTIHLIIPLSPNQFDWNVFLEHLANDLEIDRSDLIVVSAQEGSTIFKIKLRPILAQVKGTVKKISHKLLLMFLPKCEQFLTELLPSNTTKVDKIQIELKNFAEKKMTEDTGSLSLGEMDLALRLSERPAIINDDSWNFLIEKSRQLRTSILQSIQSCSDEYIIDHASIIYNEQIYDKYDNLINVDKNEKILFHGTNTINFDGIFENNFQYHSGTKRTDVGWYGQGIYFSSSPKKALYYAKSESNISYLICSLVQLGKTLTVTDMKFKGKPMHPDYDSHYVPVGVDGYPVSPWETPAFEEFVIKTSNQIMPLYIVGLLTVSCFVIWRDAKITNEANSRLFKKMKQRYAFNIYGTQTSVEAIDILKIKLINEYMKCVVVTNGADDGEGFVRQCRSIQSSLPIIVYCQNKTYHQQWARTLPTAHINVTSSPEEVFNIITNTLQK